MINNLFTATNLVGIAFFIVVMSVLPAVTAHRHVKSNGYLSGNGGFTLVEALLASIVMAIGIFAVITAIYAQVAALNENREKTIAALTAQGEIEYLRGQSFSNITSRLFYKEEAPGLEYLHLGADFGKGDIVVDNVNGNANIKRVSVIVTWTSMRGKHMHKTLATLMTSGGINKQ